MSDPMFLRNMMSNSVYAEQMHSAQIQGQTAARERATRARQEADKTERAQIRGLEEATKPGVSDREHRNGQEPFQSEEEDRSEARAEDRELEIPPDLVDFRRHIDLTV